MSEVVISSMGGGGLDEELRVFFYFRITIECIILKSLFSYKNISRLAKI